MLTHRQNEEAALAAVQVNLQHRSRNAAVLEAAPVLACDLDDTRIEALGLKGSPGELLFTKQSRQHLMSKTDRPNGDHIRDGLEHIGPACAFKQKPTVWR